MAPELRTQGMSGASDMWALGCVGLSLLTGQTMEYHWKYGFVLGSLPPQSNSFLYASASRSLGNFVV